MLPYDTGQRLNTHQKSVTGGHAEEPFASVRRITPADRFQRMGSSLNVVHDAGSFELVDGDGLVHHSAVIMCRRLVSLENSYVAHP
jgi:hypothetical protein